MAAVTPDGVTEFVNATMVLLTGALNDYNKNGSSSPVNIGILAALITSCTCFSCVTLVMMCRFRNICFGRGPCDDGSGSDSDSATSSGGVAKQQSAGISHIALPIVVSQHQSYPGHRHRGRHHRKKARKVEEEGSERSVSDASSTESTSSPERHYSSSAHHRV